MKIHFSLQESEARKNNNRIGGATVSDRYPKPKRKQRKGGLILSSHSKLIRKASMANFKSHDPTIDIIQIPERKNSSLLEIGIRLDQKTGCNL